MKCTACNRELKPVEALRVDGRSNGKPLTFFVHRPSIDGRCFRQVVFSRADAISLVEMDEFEPVVMLKTRPYHCPTCGSGDYYGKLLFEDEEVPDCPNPHADADGNRVAVKLVPVG